MKTTEMDYNKKTEIKIKLDMTEKDWKNYAFSTYHFIDNNLIDGSMFYTFLFGNSDAEKSVSRGIWKTALVKLDGVELIIPYNQYKEDTKKSCLFNAFVGDEMFVFSNEEAVKISAYFFLSHILFAGRFGSFINHNGGIDYLGKLLSKLKYELYEEIGDNAYRLLD